MFPLLKAPPSSSSHSLWPHPPHRPYPSPQCLLCANSCLVLFCCFCQAPWWTIDCSSGWVQPQHLSSFPSSFPHPLSPVCLFLSPQLFSEAKISSWGLSLFIPPPSFAPSLLPLLLLLHHCCLMPACMTAANWSHRWTEKLRFRAESQN